MSDIDKAIADLQVEIQRLHGDLQALFRAKAIVQKSHTAQATTVQKKLVSRPRKKASAVSLAMTVLQQAGTPLHISEIVKRIQEMGVRKVPTKASLGSTMIRYAKQGKMFIKTDKPNTFGILPTPVREAAA